MRFEDYKLRSIPRPNNCESYIKVIVHSRQKEREETIDIDDNLYEINSIYFGEIVKTESVAIQSNN